MRHDFDEIIDRRHTDSAKHDFAVENGMPEDVTPLWVADMDFRTAPSIVEKLKSLAETGVYGYTRLVKGGEYFSAVKLWFKKYHDWDVQEDWIVRVPGVVFALSAAINTYTKPGNAVLIQRPVYHPFASVVKDNNRKLVNNPLKLVDGKYTIDFDDFEAKIIDEDVKLFLLCSPHNPVGRVWKEWELRKLGDICLKHDVIVVSDEIHQDLTFGDNKHYTFSRLGKKYANISVICTAPSKTFNLAGLQNSNVFIENKALRDEFKAYLNNIAYHETNMFALAATVAAYRDSHDWYEELKIYLQGNLDCVKNKIQEQIPQINVIEPEGTYLVWLDFRNFGLTHEQLEKIIVHKAKLWFDSGTKFGEEGKGFERLNLASPRRVLIDAIDRLAKAFEEELN